MSNEQRARNLLMEIWDAPDRETGVALIAAAKVEYEREALERAAKWHDNLAAQSRKEARQKDEEGWFQKGKDARENARWHEHFAFAIRALPPEPAAPDLTKALARLFADWWTREQAGFQRFQTAYVTDRDFLKAGLIEPDGMIREKLTDLGRAALKFARDGG